MADISDCEQALLSFLTQIAYPLGTANPSAVVDSIGNPHAVQLYRGWPVPEQLDADMTAGIVDVSIFATRVEQNVTRYGLDYDEVLPFPSPTLTLVLGHGDAYGRRNGVRAAECGSTGEWLWILL